MAGLLRFGVGRREPDRSRELRHVRHRRVAHRVERQHAAIAGQAAAAAPDPTAREETLREQAHSKPREAVDDADDILIKPFAWAAEGSSSRWARKGVPTLLALLVYGFALGFLARGDPHPGVSAVAARFGTGRAWTIGVEEELIVVDARTHALAAHRGRGDRRDGRRRGAGRGQARHVLGARRARLAGQRHARARASRRCRPCGHGCARPARSRSARGSIPTAAFGDVEHVPEARYAAVVAQLGGLIRRTPTCALHVHVGVPDAEAAIRACNGLRAHLPLLQALAANSPFWFGHDSRLATARAQLFRAYPRAEIPRAFADYDDYAASVASVVAAGDLPDYTFLWWDVRPHPNLGTVEVRAMDSQSALWSAAALAALVQCLVRAAAADATGRGRRARR